MEALRRLEVGWVEFFTRPNADGQPGPPLLGLARGSTKPTSGHDSSGDQAGSDAKLGVGIRISLRPVISTENSDGPELPPGSRKNISTRPLGAKVGPSL